MIFHILLLIILEIHLHVISHDRVSEIPAGTWVPWSTTPFINKTINFSSLNHVIK